MDTELKYCPILHLELMNSIDALTEQLESLGYQLEITSDKNKLSLLTKTYYQMFTQLMKEWAKLDMITIYYFMY